MEGQANWELAVKFLDKWKTIYDESTAFDFTTPAQSKKGTDGLTDMDEVLARGQKGDQFRCINFIGSLKHYLINF